MKRLSVKIILFLFVTQLVACDGNKPELPSNFPPTVNVGSDKTVPDGSVVRLLGNSSVPEDQISSIIWAQVSGATVELTEPNQLNTGVTIHSGLEGELLTFSLEVKDKNGVMAKDEVSIEVGPPLPFVDYKINNNPESLNDVSINIDLGKSTLVSATNVQDGYTTIIVENTSSFNFIIKPDSLTITGPGAPNILIGDVIVGVKKDQSAGYARKVTAINGNVLSTTTATLNEIFTEAKVNLSISISNDTAPNLASSGLQQAEKPKGVDILNFNRNLQWEISPGVKTVTNLNMNSRLDVDFDFSIKSGTITYLSSIVSADYSAASYLDVNLSKKNEELVEKEFNPIFDKSKVIYISSIPVFVNVKAVPVMRANVSMSAAGALKYGFKVSGAVRAGFEYVDLTLTDIAEFNPEMSKIGPEYTLNGNLNLNAVASVAVIVTLFEDGLEIPIFGKFEFSGPGLGVDLGPYANFKAESEVNSQKIPILKCALDLSVGIKSDLSIDYGSIGSQLQIDNPENINLYKWNRTLWSADECPPGP